MPQFSPCLLGYQCVERAVQALPYKIQIHEAPADDTAKVKQARSAVVASIDPGVPVQYGSEKDGIIIGYQKHGEEWICLHPPIQIQAIQR